MTLPDWLEPYVVREVTGENDFTARALAQLGSARRPTPLPHSLSPHEDASVRLIAAAPAALRCCQPLAALPPRRRRPRLPRRPSNPRGRSSGPTRAAGTPNGVRTGSGEPGPGYWQQRADYVIRATLDTASRSVRGEERITYTNNSPDTLRYVWLQLEQNLFNSESRGYRVFGQDPRFGTKGAEVSVSPAQGGRAGAAATQAKPGVPARAAVPASALEYTVNGTEMRIDLARPLPPKGKQLLELAWSFPFGANSNRMGIEDIDGVDGLRGRAVVSRAWRCTTTCAAGTPSSTSARASSTWSTAASTSA